VAKRDVISDEAITETTYVHDDLGRLVRSVTGGVATFYGWDAASNLVGEGGTDDPSTTKVGDAYAIARTVNEANQLVTLVKNPVGTPGGKVETTEFSYDARGNRTGSVTTTVTGKKTHTVASSTLVYDSMDQLTSTTGPEGSASWVRDGVGRALEVTEGGVTSARLYDGLTVVAQGDTQFTMGPNGQVLAESTTTTTTKGKTTTTSVASVDVLTDVLGSAVATASDGVISADLALFGDFGDPLTTPKAATSTTATVTGFTGKIATAGLVEFASRIYDPVTRQWVQDDRYRGAATRSASMNRYAYVEGAPDSFVDVLGFFRARAALEAQRLAALDAAFQSALDELNQFVVAQSHLQGWKPSQMMAAYNMFHASDDPVVRAAMDQIARKAFYGVWDYQYQQKVQVALAEKAQAERQAKFDAIERQYQADQAQIQAEKGNTFLYDAATTVSTVVTTMSPMEIVHSALDVVGMIPIIGEAADLVNGAIYLAQGDLANAALSMMAMVPVLGSTATGARIVATVATGVTAAVKAAKATRTATKAVDETKDLLKIFNKFEDTASLTKAGTNATEAATDATRAATKTVDEAVTAAKTTEPVPVVEFSRSRSPNIAENFDEAVAQGQPTQLTRADAAQRDINRREALAGHDPAPSGQSLDEYPFASTLEGGSGASVRPVPIPEQNYQGGVLSAAFKKIPVGEKFNVVFVD